MAVVPQQDLGFLERVAFAFVCFFKILFNPAFAARALLVRYEMPTAPATLLPTARGSLEPPAPESPRQKKRVVVSVVDAESTRNLDKAREEGFLLLLASLQKHGRLVDFLQDDVAAYSDEEVGAAARVVHAGCSKILGECVEIAPVHQDPEGSSVVIRKGFDPQQIKLSGKLVGDPPYSGTLKHKGWRASNPKLPTFTSDAEPRILQQAEVEL